MASKYYAVKKGRKTGIFMTWSDCQAQVKGYSGAIFKSFPTKKEAELFLGSPSTSKPMTENGSKNVIYRNLNTPIDHKKDESFDVVAYIDGSFDKKLGVVGSGGVIIHNGEKTEFSFGTKEPQYTAYWNVAGELLGALYVMEWAKRVGATTCALYYDYMGIEMWAVGNWKTNNELTTWYAKEMKAYMESITVVFNKVKAHTGVVYNERADILAKDGLLKV